jgi:hypothetical protein
MFWIFLEFFYLRNRMSNKKNSKQILNKFITNESKVVENIYFLFFWGARPGSASGCFKKATQTPNAGHPILELF